MRNPRSERPTSCSADVNGENRWSRVEHDTFCWPYGLSHHGEHLAVADSGNNRVMVWRVGP